MESKRLEIYSRIIFALIIRIVLNFASSFVPVLGYVSTIFGLALIVYIVLMLRTPAMTSSLLKGEKKIATIFYLYAGIGIVSMVLQFIYAFNSTSNAVIITSIIPTMYLLTLLLNVMLFFIFVYYLSLNIKIVKSVA